MPMPVIEKISTIDDMKALLNELHRLEAKLLFDFYGVLQDFSSKKFLPQWYQKKGIKNSFITEKGNDVLLKIYNSKKCSLVVYDLETHDLNGLQFLAALDKKPEVKAKCKVIMVTPELTQDVKTKILNHGANAVIGKTITEEALQNAFLKVGLDY